MSESEERQNTHTTSTVMNSITSMSPAKIK